ncbi:hypothetical protein INF26_07375 [Olsenella sp. DSM 107455]|uniref:Uncharacterized protein n=1 Tax=Thermophilibacter gallinarum TaxID=2779357 RepID=A0ABR9QUA7_9ACTN|nr:hypothetical protein [Thermophilibacter gallinarum]MBE5024670.1 hypothetical protein [Thermophilibacter gallinarum]
MDAFTFRLLTHIKRAYETSCGVARYELVDSGAAVGTRQFYVRDLTDNLIRPMSERHKAEFSHGSGKELEDKMRALRSSSAMTFNVLGNEIFSVQTSSESLFEALPPGCYHVTYEYQIPTLRRGLPANLDALLHDGKGRIVACEFKYLEWVLGAPKPLRPAYFERARYRHAHAAEAFVPAAKGLESRGFERLDYAQLFKHTLALYNACVEGRLSHAHTLTLLNVVWEPPNRSEALSRDELRQLAAKCEDERHEFAKFLEEMAPARKSFEAFGVRFSMVYLPVSKLISIGSYPAAERERLYRYVW